MDEEADRFYDADRVVDVDVLVTLFQHVVQELALGIQRSDPNTERPSET